MYVTDSTVKVKGQTSRQQRQV